MRVEVILLNEDVHFFPFKFNVVDGTFDGRNTILLSLKGSPKIVKGNFLCKYNLLTTLIGATEIVRGNFDASSNELTSLLHIPKNV